MREQRGPTPEREAVAGEELEAAGFSVRLGANPRVLVAERGTRRVFGRSVSDLRYHLRLARPDAPVEREAA